jgi:hypothetical protein
VSSNTASHAYIIYELDRLIASERWLPAAPHIPDVVRAMAFSLIASGIAAEGGYVHQNFIIVNTLRNTGLEDT